MPSLSANAATYRAGNYFFRGFIGTFPQTVVHSGSLSATPTFPATAISISTGAGTSANVLRGMTIRITSSTGVFKGLLRVASSGTISNATLPVNEVSANTVNLVSGDLFSVVQEWRIWDMLVSATAALNKDSRITFSDQAANPEPIANLGGLWFGFVDAGQVFATVTFDGTASIIVDPDGGSLSYLWSVGAGTITVGTTTTSSITATFPVGFYIVTLTITNSGSGKTRTRYIPVRVYGHDSNQPLAVYSDGGGYTSHDEGWGLRFQLPKGSESAQSTLPDGTLIVYFEDEYYGAALGSYGSNVANRSHVKFVGYLARETVHIDGLNNTVEFEAISPLAVLNRTPALPQLMVQTTGAGSKWRHVKSLTINRALWYILHYGATFDVLFDFVWKSGTDFAYRRLAITETSSIGAQLRDIAQSINAQVTCDRLGRLLIIADPNYLSSAARSALTTTYGLAVNEFRELDFTREHRGNVKSVRVNAITDGATAALNRPVFSNAGNAPSSIGTNTETLDKQIVDNQADSNNRAGWHFARLNGLYNGQYVPQGARFRLPSGYDWIDPAYREWFTLTLAATTNKRGLAYTASERWTAESLDISYDPETGTKEITVTLDHETDGPAGVKYVPPQPTDNGLPPYTPPIYNLPPILLPDDGSLKKGISTIAGFNTGGGLYITTDFETPGPAGGPTWTRVSLSGLGMGGTLQDFVVDPFSPLYRGTGTTVNGWIVTTTQIGRITDIFNAAASRAYSVQYTFTFANQFASIQCERGVQNWVVCSTYRRTTPNNFGTNIAYTTDGTNWTENNLTSFVHTTLSLNQRPTLIVSPHTAGLCFAGAYSGTNAGAWYRSPDYGATFAAAAYPDNFGIFQGGFCHRPYKDTTDKLLYYGRMAGSAGSETLQTFRLGTDGVTETDITPSVGLGPRDQRSIHSCDSNRLYMAAVFFDFPAGANLRYLYSSGDGGLNWTLRESSTAYRSVSVGSNDPSILYAWGASAIGFSSDYGAYVDDRTGNAAGLGTFGTFVNICGG